MHIKSLEKVSLLSLLCGISILAPGLVLGQGTAAAGVTIPVDSPAAHFSPGNWSGDAGRAGKISRATWENGAYCAFYWTSTSATPTASLDITNATATSRIAYFIDGYFVDKVAVPATGSTAITHLSGIGEHELIICPDWNPDVSRWDRSNVYTVKGLTLDAQSQPRPAPFQYRPWVSIIGDSITEGVGVPCVTEDYAYLVGQGLLRAGFDFGTSACGWSGWLHPGDRTGDVPPYYSITGSTNGTGGIHKDETSRWNKIDAKTSLLDSDGHISGWGGTHQEPAAILLDYMVNEALSGANLSDAQASVTQGLAALRKASPRTWIIVLVPPGLHNTEVYKTGPAYVAALQAGVKAYQAAHPEDTRTLCVDLGERVSNILASQHYGGGVHFNAAGHAYITPLILQMLLSHLQPSAGTAR